MFDRYQAGESAVLVQVLLNKQYISNDMHELEQLAKAANLRVFGHLEIKRSKPHPKYFIGQGKIEELAELVNKLQANVIIFNNQLSPSQERDLEKFCQCRVLDRTILILDIFAQRARTHEGKLQVELAQLNYLSTRLVRGWTHLERQKGGVGLRGPGEKQLETDKRLLQKRIHSILNKLKIVESRRHQTRKRRAKSELPVISLIGYTNAGKSTLFNHATCSSVLAENKLFATLDPTFRRMNLISNQHCILADTVGLIRNLPHELVKSFNATLQESRDADLLLHVVDASDPMRNLHIETVRSVIDAIGAQAVPTLVIYNKIDLLECSASRIEYDNSGSPMNVWLSSKHEEDIKLLRQAIIEKLQYQVSSMNFYFPAEYGYLPSLLYKYLDVVSKELDSQGGCRICVKTSIKDWQSLVDETHGLIEKFLVFSDTIN